MRVNLFITNKHGNVVRNIDSNIYLPHALALIAELEWEYEFLEGERIVMEIV